MSTHQSPRDAFLQLGGNTNTPLLSETEILESIRHSESAVPNSFPVPKDTPFRRVFHGSAIRFSSIVILACCLGILGYFAFRSNPNVSTGHSQNAKHANADTKTLMERGLGSAGDAAYELPPSTPMHSQLHSASGLLPDSTPHVKRTPDYFAAMHLHVTTSSVTYTENGYTVLIKTNGISAKGTRDSNARYTPRHISLYRNGNAFASWFNKVFADVSSLVPIRIHLTDSTNPLFTSADVILWYIPTAELKSALPSAHMSSNGSTNIDVSLPTSSTEQQPRQAAPARYTVYPNPVHGDAATVEMHCSVECTSSAALFDINGSRVLDVWANRQFAATNTSVEIVGLSELANGMYVLTVQIDGAQTINQRILIER